VVATALVDHADESLLREYRWKLNNGYASRYDRNSGSAVVMHRQIMGLAKGDPLVVDHINGKRLDNRRANLRVVTAAENSQNTPSRRGAASRYRNVFWNTRTGYLLAASPVPARLKNRATLAIATAGDGLRMVPPCGV
jgi:hypothetical protein